MMAGASFKIEIKAFKLYVNICKDQHIINCTNNKKIGVFIVFDDLVVAKR